jgi:D-galactose 1-dehydrogenase/L-arabinose 1- dehydrogenase
MAGEYPRLYRRFADLCESNASEVDLRPFQLVADAFLVGERRIVAPHVV